MNRTADLHLSTRTGVVTDRNSNRPVGRLVVKPIGGRGNRKAWFWSCQCHGDRLNSPRGLGSRQAAFDALADHTAQQLAGVGREA
jgi:hypothetical protein